MSIYDFPETLGFEQVADIDYSDGDYCFDYRMVWKQKDTGKFYTARDAGCSCPSPFEDYHKLEDFDEIRDTEALKAEAFDQLTSDYSHVTNRETQEFIEAVERAMREEK